MACADYNTIDLDLEITGKAQRKQLKALRDQKRNLEKMLTAVLDQIQSDRLEKLIIA